MQLIPHLFLRSDHARLAVVVAAVNPWMSPIPDSMVGGKTRLCTILPLDGGASFMGEWRECLCRSVNPCGLSMRCGRLRCHVREITAPAVSFVTAANDRELNLSFYAILLFARLERFAVTYFSRCLCEKGCVCLPLCDDLLYERVGLPDANFCPLPC
eukprot:scaffold360_cov374-Pavlova_lutheri.AAC.37